MGYRLYSINPYTRRFDGVRVIEASNDVEAVDAAESHVGDGKAFELWFQARKVKSYDLDYRSAAAE